MTGGSSVTAVGSGGGYPCGAEAPTATHETMFIEHPRLPTRCQCGHPIEAER